MNWASFTSSCKMQVISLQIVLLSVYFYCCENDSMENFELTPWLKNATRGSKHVTVTPLQPSPREHAAENQPVNVNDVSFFGQLQRQVFGFLHVVPLDYDVGSKVSTRLDLDDRCHRGHDHRDRYVEPLPVIAQRLRVIAQGRGYYTVSFVLVGQHHQRVACAAFFEAKSLIEKKNINPFYLNTWRAQNIWSDWRIVFMQFVGV